MKITTIPFLFRNLQVITINVSASKTRPQTMTAEYRQRDKVTDKTRRNKEMLKVTENGEGNA